MRIVFINYYEYRVSSGVHIHFLANELTRLGHECTVVLPRVANIETFGAPEYSFSDTAGFETDIRNGRYTADTVFHAWTPRDAARLPTLLASRTTGAPYFVHMEDNERNVLASHLGRPFEELARAAARGEAIPGNLHPVLHQTFLEEAAGVTLLMDRLAEFVPASVPTQLIWPACEREFFQIPTTPNLRLRRRLGIEDDCSVIVYPGNVHHANCATVNNLYLALPLLEAAGHKIRLVRCAGRDSAVRDLPDLAGRYVIAQPELPSKKLPEWIAMADVLVQPGAPDAFDEYRFPSKLPLFLASGRPVVLARTNLGRFLDDGENCLILAQNTPEGIAAKVDWLLRHRGEAARIGHNGRKFAAANFNWGKSAKTLLDFYSRCRSR